MTQVDERDFSTTQRKDAAQSGDAMSDGSFPIKNVSDLKNAIQALGRAKNPDKAKRHIIKRARKLGAIGSLPPDWNVSEVEVIQDSWLEEGISPALAEALQEVVTSAAGAKGNEKLHAYWRTHIKWGHPGDFAECVAHLSKYIKDPKGYCAKMHKDVTGATPGHAAGEAAVSDEEGIITVDELVEMADESDIAEASGGKVYHWKHGWIPLNHPAAKTADIKYSELTQATADLKSLEQQYRFKKKAGIMSHEEIHYKQMIKDARARLKRAQGSKESADRDDTLHIHETVDLTERQAQPTRSGRWSVVAISAGKGSSGYYAPQVLEDAAQKQLIAAGTPLFFDHPTESARTDRPERSVRDIAAVFTKPATYDPRSQALVGEVQVFGPYRDLVNEMAPHIGLSISGSATDVTEGPDGKVVEGLARIDSVDLVTRAGRGGQFVQLLESAREQMDHLHLYDDLKETDVSDPNPQPEETAPETPEGAPAAPPENPAPAEPVAETTHTPSKETQMTDVTEGAGGTAPAPPRNPREVMERQIQEQGRQIALLRAGQAAQGIVAEVLATGWIGEAQRARLSSVLIADLPLTESGELDEGALRERAQHGLDEAETEAAEILQAAGVGSPRGLGALETPATESAAASYEKDFRTSLKERGLSDAAIEIAVKGR